LRCAPCVAYLVEAGVPGGTGRTWHNRAYLAQPGVPGTTGRTWHNRAYLAQPGVPGTTGRTWWVLSTRYARSCEPTRARWERTGAHDGREGRCQLAPGLPSVMWVRRAGGLRRHGLGDTSRAHVRVVCRSARNRARTGPPAPAPHRTAVPLSGAATTAAASPRAAPAPQPARPKPCAPRGAPATRAPRPRRRASASPPAARRAAAVGPPSPAR